MRPSLLCALILLNLSVCGCGKEDLVGQHSKYADKMLVEMQGINDQLESVTDVTTATAAVPKIKEHIEKINNFQKEMDALTELSEEQETEFDKKYDPKVEEQADRLMAHATRISEVDPDAAEIVGDVLKALEN